ncbi:MAG: hypothetical protein HY276_05465 [Ignavibacteriales bacterium]|nr:hypothetical protein [Ignavibacteriales bacterium]MBI3787690.1 hypothetical protein [Ignavibacteriales bacterium]
MRMIIGVLLMFSLIFAGCGKQEELEQRNKELAQELQSKDKFIEEVTSNINEIHGALEAAWAMEKKIVRQTTTAEGSKALTSAELKQSILSRISDMSSALSDNRKKITSLEKRLKGLNVQYVSLTKMVDQLKTDLEEREKSITELQSRIQSLESDVAKKAEIIAARETTIASHESTILEQRKMMNTVYFAVGSRDELKKKGVITEEGGILWGLLGTTTTLAGNFDVAQFEPVERSRTAIEVSGAIDEIVPKRDESFYTKEQSENGHTILRIVKPESFWRENHLVIVTH